VAQSDVDLVIRGTDQASDVFKEVAEATAKLSKQLDSASNSAAESDPKVQQARQAYDDLKQSLEKLSIAGKVVNDFKIAEQTLDSAAQSANAATTKYQQLVDAQKSVQAAMARFNAAFANSSEEAERLNASLQRLRDTKNNLETTDRKNIQSLNEQKQKLAEQIAEQDRLNRQYEEANRIRSDAQATFGSLSNAVDQSSAAIERQKDVIGSLGDEQKFVNDQIKATSTQIKSAEKAFDSMSVTVEKTTAKIQESESKIGELGDEFTQLDQKISRASQEQDEARVDFEQLSIAVAEAKTELDEYRQSVGRSRTNEQKAQIAALESAYKELKSELTEASKAYFNKSKEIDKLVTKQKKLPAVIEAERSKLVQLRSERDSQNASITQNIQLQDSLKNTLKQLNVALAKNQSELKEQEAALKQMEAAHAGLRTELKNSEQFFKGASAGVVDLNKALEKNESQIKETEQKLAGLVAELKAYGNSLDDLDGAENKRVQALKAIEDAIERTSTELKDQKSLNKDLERSLQSLTKEYEQYSRKIGRAKNAETEALASLQRSREALKAKEQAVAALGADVNKLSNYEAELAAEVRKTSGELGRAAANTKKASQAAREYAAEANRAAAADKKWGDSQRTALSLMQRIHGQVLSLAAAYVGVYEGINLVTTSLQTYIDKQAAVARISTILSDNTAQVGRELEYVKRVSDELKLPLDALRDNYSKLFVAMKQQGQSGDEIRTVFEGVNTAARAMNLSVDDVEGTFRAITQIFGKGKVMAEELTQQLGDRFPAAIPLMAKAVGVGTAELFKMMEQGKITSDYMVKFAEVLKKEYTPGLDVALDSWQALTTELRNAAIILKEQMGEKLAKALEEPVKRLTAALKSGDLDQYVDMFVQGVKALAEGVVWFTENIEKVTAALEVFVAFKLAEVLAGWTTNILGVANAARKAGKPISLLSAAIRAIPLAVPITVTIVGITAATRAVEYLGEKLAELQTAGMMERAEESMRRTREELHGVYVQVLNNVTALNEYKDLQVLSAKEVAKLSTEEYELYAERVEGHRKYNDAVLHSQRLAKQLGYDIEDQTEKAEQGLANVAQAYRNLDAEARAFLDGVNPLEMLSEDAEKLVGSFDAARGAADGVEEGIKEILDTVDLLERQEFVAFGTALDELAQQGKLSAEELGATWDAALNKLSDEGLAKFAIEAKATFEETERDSRALAEALDSVLRVQFERLGISMEEALGTRLSQTSQNAITNIKGIAAAMEIAGITGVEKFQALEMAIDAAINKADNEAAIIRLTDIIDGMAKTGDLAADSAVRLKQKLKEQREEIEKLIPGIQSLREVEERTNEAKIKALKTAAELAKLRGQEAYAARLLAAAAKLEAESTAKTALEKYNLTKASLAAAKAMYAEIAANKESTPAQIANAKAAIELAEAEIAAAESALQLAEAKKYETGAVEKNTTAKKENAAASREAAEAGDDAAEEATPRARVAVLRRRLEVAEQVLGTGRG